MSAEMQDTDQESRPDFSSAAIGRIVALTGSHAVVLLQGEPGLPMQSSHPPQIGSFVKFTGNNIAVVLGIVTAMNVPMPSSSAEMRLVEIDLVGELPHIRAEAAGRFRRGVSVYPTLGDQALPADAADLAQIFGHDGEGAIRLGHVRQARDVPVWVGRDTLFGNHLAIVGDREAGKSSVLAILLRRLAETTPQARIILFDQKGEHAVALADHAEVISPKDLSLPYWLLTVEELAAVLKCGEGEAVDAAVLIPLVSQAKQRYFLQTNPDPAPHAMETGQPSAASGASLPADAPMPYRLADLIELLDGPARRSEPDHGHASRMRLRDALQRTSRNPRFLALFGKAPEHDAIADVLARIFRVPGDGAGITLISLRELPSEVAGVVVAALSRMALDLGVFGGGQLPLVIACENAEAHAPADERHMASPAAKALARVAREGAAHGITLAVTSTRPGELDPAILSRCATVLAARLTREPDLHAIHHTATGTLPSLLDPLLTLPPGEVVVFGGGLLLPCVVTLHSSVVGAHPQQPANALAAGAKTGNLGQRHIAEAMRSWLIRPWSEQATQTVVSHLPEAQHAANQPSEHASRPPPAEQQQTDESIDWRSLRARIIATAGSKWQDAPGGSD